MVLKTKCKIEDIDYATTTNGNGAYRFKLRSIFTGVEYVKHLRVPTNDIECNMFLRQTNKIKDTQQLTDECFITSPEELLNIMKIMYVDKVVGLKTMSSHTFDNAMIVTFLTDSEYDNLEVQV